MIQRQQTLWLLLAVACSILGFIFPVYSGQKVEPNLAPIYDELMAGSSLPLLILTGISVLIGAIAIFMFKDRKTQVKLSGAGIAISIILVLLYFFETKKFESGRFALTSVFLLGLVIGYIMATRGILKDEKLVKSLNKLR
jgi:predicted MFS family arabinose efflux permease